MLISPPPVFVCWFKLKLFLYKAITGSDLDRNDSFSPVSLHDFKVNPIFLPAAYFSSAVQQSLAQVSLFHHKSLNLSPSFIRFTAWITAARMKKNPNKLITALDSSFYISGSSVSVTDTHKFQVPLGMSSAATLAFHDLPSHLLHQTNVGKLANNEWLMTKQHTQGCWNTVLAQRGIQSTASHFDWLRRGSQSVLPLLKERSARGGTTAWQTRP